MLKHFHNVFFRWSADIKICYHYFKSLFFLLKICLFINKDLFFVCKTCFFNRDTIIQIIKCDKK